MSLGFVYMWVAGKNNFLTRIYEVTGQLTVHRFRESVCGWKILKTKVSAGSIWKFWSNSSGEKRNHIFTRQESNKFKKQYIKILRNAVDVYMC